MEILALRDGVRFPWSEAASVGHPALLVAWIIAATAFVAYMLFILVALVRVGRQYGAGMRGKIGLRVSAILTEGARRWYILLVALIALAVALLSH